MHIKKIKLEDNEMKKIKLEDTEMKKIKVGIPTFISITHKSYFELMIFL